MSEQPDKRATNADDVYLKSMFYEQLVEHVFVSEVLQEAWYYFGTTVGSGVTVGIRCKA